jgi:hypothetical protein
MNLFIGLISTNEKICEEFNKKRDGLIPTEVRSKEKIKRLNPVFSIGTYNPAKDERTVEEYLSYATRRAEAAVLLVDSRHLDAIQAIRSAFFITPLNIGDGELNYKNFFGQIFPRLLTNFSDLMSTMGDSSNEQVMALPLRNFHANELLELARICREETMLGTFRDAVIEQVIALKERKRPRRDVDGKQKFLVDDNALYFDYGKEVHARLATGAPHLKSCVLTGNFRFGKRIETNRHYNMTRLSGGQTKISGEFLNCHDHPLLVKESSHINIFSNDYH